MEQICPATFCEVVAWFCTLYTYSETEFLKQSFKSPRYISTMTFMASINKLSSSPCPLCLLCMSLGKKGWYFIIKTILGGNLEAKEKRCLKWARPPRDTGCHIVCGRSLCIIFNTPYLFRGEPNVFLANGVYLLRSFSGWFYLGELTTFKDWFSAVQVSTPGLPKY